MNTYHPSQYKRDGTLIPLWPGASHFASWYFYPHTLNGKPADLYFWQNKGREYASLNDLLIGIQVSGEDGDYMSPFIETGNALHHRYHDDNVHEVMSAYLIACITLGITPSFSKPR